MSSVPYPVIAEMLLGGRTNLSVVAMISKIINNTNGEDILNTINNRSYREAERLLSVYRPVPKERDRVRAISVLEEDTGMSSGSGADGRLNSDNCGIKRECDTGVKIKVGSDAGAGVNCDVGNEVSSDVGSGSGSDRNGAETGFSSDVGTEYKLGRGFRHDKSGSGSGGNYSGGNNDQPEKKIILKNKYELKFMVDPEFMNKLNKIKSLLSNKFPGGIGFELLFNQLMEEYLEKHDPQRRMIRIVRD